MTPSVCGAYTFKMVIIFLILTSLMFSVIPLRDDVQLFFYDMRIFKSLISSDLFSKSFVINGNTSVLSDSFQVLCIFLFKFLETKNPNP